MLCCHNPTVDYIDDGKHANVIYVTLRGPLWKKSSIEHRCILRSVLRCVRAHCTSHLGSQGCPTWHIFKYSSKLRARKWTLWHVRCSYHVLKEGEGSREKWELEGGERNQGEQEKEFGKRNTGRTTGRESWGTRHNMKTAAVDKSAGCGDTPALWPGSSPPHSSAKTPFVWGIGKKSHIYGGKGKGEREWEGDAEKHKNT